MKKDNLFFLLFIFEKYIVKKLREKTERR